MKINIVKLLQPRSVSNSFSRRMILSGAIRLNGNVISDITEIVDVNPGDVLWIGKHERIEITEEFLTQDVFHAG